MTDISLVTPYLSKKEQDELMSIKKQPFFRGGIINKEFITVDRLKDIISINNGEDFFWTKKVLEIPIFILVVLIIYSIQVLTMQ